MAEQGEWVECVQPSAQSALPQLMSNMVAKSGGLGVPVTQTIANLLTTIMEHKDDLKGSSVNKVLRKWPSHLCQFSTCVMKMSDVDRAALQIADPKVVQAKIDSLPGENALQAAAKEKVTLGQLGIRKGSISEANSEAIDLSTFKAKDDISALSLVEEVKAALDDMELGDVVKKLHRYLSRATRSLNSAWDHTQTASLANTDD